MQNFVSTPIRSACTVPRRRPNSTFPGSAVIIHPFLVSLQVRVRLPYMSQQSLPSDDGEEFSRHFRNALGMFATGVTVVTTRSESGELFGLTVNSFNSVSLQPPLIVWSLALDWPGRQHFERCESYAINVLAEDQQPLSERFAGGQGDKFAGLELDFGPDGVPLLQGCCARFICRNSTRHAGGDHLVFISEVLAFEYFERLPLLYFGGRYRQLAS